MQPWTIILYLLLTAIPGFILYLILRPRIPEVINHWSLYFSDRQFSSQDFYQTVERLLIERKAPDLHFIRVELNQRDFFSDKREYCRIRFGHYTFDICAAPYGTGYFTSWWFGEDIPLLTRMLYAIPLVGWYLKRRHNIKTYYIRDNESVFQAAVHQAVLDTIERLSADKGLRALSNTERQTIGALTTT